MARRVTVQPQAELDIEAAALWYDDQQSGLGANFLNELDQVSSELKKTPYNSHGWKPTPVERFSTAFPTGCTSSPNRKT